LGWLMPGMQVAIQQRVHSSHHDRRSSMSMFRNRIVVLALTAAPVILAAQQDQNPARPISLDEAVRLAVMNSPLTVGARNALRTGRVAEMNALGQYLPNINLNYSAGNASGGQFIQGQLVPFQGYPWGYNKGYNASLLLFDGGQRWFGYLQAQANQRANAENETLQRYGVALLVKQQYYAVLQARELEAAGASALEQAQVALNASSARVKVGAVVRTDSLRAAIQVGSARLSLLTARAQLRDANAALTRLVASNLPVTAIAADTSDIPRVEVDDESLTRMADDGPTVRQAVASYQAAKQGRRATITSQYLPRVSAGYSFSANAYQTPDFNWGGGPTASKQTFYSFGLSYSVFNGFTRELSMMQATVLEDNAEAQLRDARFNAKANLAQLVDQFRTAAQTVELQQLQIAAAADDLAAQQSRYALGASSYLDLLTSQTALDTQRILLINARFSARTAKATIEAFIGRDLK
jgi:outer membrane protein